MIGTKSVCVTYLPPPQARLPAPPRPPLGHRPRPLPPQQRPGPRPQPRPRPRHLQRPC